MQGVLDSLLLPKITEDTKSFFGMSSIVKSGIKHTNKKTKDKIDTFLNEPLFRVSDLGKKYRTINYLEATGLINDARDQKGVGWRKLGLSEYVYISVLLELRRYGLKSDVLKNFKELYEEYSLYALFAILAGHEVIMIFKPNGFCAMLDPTFLGLYEDESFLPDVIPRRDNGEIQLKLSVFTSYALGLIGKPKPMIQYSLPINRSNPTSGGLKKYEKKLLEATKNLEHGEGKSITLRRLKDNSILLGYSGNMSVDNEIVQSLSSLVDEGYCDLTVSLKDRKVVSLKKNYTEKLETN
ncbi:MAG TPA: hypothetical protein PKD19_01855 [Candidatus Saccharibacteria bacterium]|nr:hypothetical protein [Candidatus Saccharibacteria bacterium]HMR38361.1 hypothetical protein [Candidatus Saccharibacteria bacterium]